QRRIWSIVARASSVGVLVMVWTLIGASPPTGTEPTMICRDLRRSISRQGRMEDILTDSRLLGPAYRQSAAGRKPPEGIRALYPIVLTGLTNPGGGSMLKLAQVPEDQTAAQPQRAPLSRIRRSRPKRTRRHKHRYYAFLSYSHKEEALADWLHSELEAFHVSFFHAAATTEN